MPNSWSSPSSDSGVGLLRLRADTSSGSRESIPDDRRDARELRECDRDDKLGCRSTSAWPRDEVDDDDASDRSDRDPTRASIGDWYLDGSETDRDP